MERDPWSNPPGMRPTGGHLKTQSSPVRSKLHFSLIQCPALATATICMVPEACVMVTNSMLRGPPPYLVLMIAHVAWAMASIFEICVHLLLKHQGMLCSHIQLGHLQLRVLSPDLFHTSHLQRVYGSGR